MQSLDLSRLTPADAIVAIESYPRRIRAALAPVRDDEAIASVARMPGSSGRSAIDIASELLASWSSLSAGLNLVHLYENPTMPSRRMAPEASDSLDEMFEQLGGAAASLAEVARRISGRDWQRGATTATGETTTAIDILKVAVTEGHDALVDIAQVLNEVRSAL